MKTKHYLNSDDKGERDKFVIGEKIIQPLYMGIGSAIFLKGFRNV